MVMGDMGATVLKIEHPEGGDDSRSWGPPFVNGESCYYLSINRNKQSVAINFKHSEGAKLIQKLVCQSDVLVENFLPGTLKKYGLDYDTLSAMNERLIYASISSYGATGPDSKMPGYDVILSAKGGLMGITGDEKAPAKVGVAQTDIATGLFMQGAITAALFKRERTGKGQHLDTSLLEVQVASLANIGQNYLSVGLEGKRWGTAHASIVPYQAFATSDSYITAGALNDHQFVTMCKLMAPELAENPKYVTNQLRVKHRTELIATLSALFAKKTTAEWLSLLKAIPCAAVNSIQQVFEDEQVRAREMILEFEHPTVGTMKTAGFPIKFSESPCALYRPPPLLGENTREVLSGILGLSSSDIATLQRDHVIKLRDE